MATKKKAPEKIRMTIHRALAELKLVDSKIEKSIGTIVPVGIYQRGKKIDGHLTLEEFTAQAQAGYQSTIDLIRRKEAIKAAIVTANGKTIVKVAGKRMTISDAITMKTTIAFKKLLVERLRTVLKDRIGQLNKANETVKANEQALLKAALGKEQAEVKKTDIEAISKPFLEANEVHLHDPLKVQQKMDSLEKEISDFETEVDAVLSEVNATTFIEI